MRSSLHYGLTISPEPIVTAVTARPATLAAGRETMSFLFVQIGTDAGVVGTGEACDSYGCSYAPWSVGSSKRCSPRC